MKNINDVNQLIWMLDRNKEIAAAGIYVEGIFVPFWMLVRFSLNLELAALVGSGLSSPKKFSFSHKIKYLINAYRYRLKRASQKTDLLFISPAVGNVYDAAGYVENIYHDLFAKSAILLHKNVLVMEQAGLWQLFDTKRHIKPVCAMNWTFLKFKIKGLFSFVKAEAQIASFINLLDEHLKKHAIQSAPIIHSIKTYLCRKVSSLKYDIRMWEAIINKVQPKVIIMQDICYGGASGVASLSFKKHGVVVVEDQHGFINEAHVAYFYDAGLLRDPVFSAFFPDYFLGYGEAWLKTMNVNSKKQVIGNPYLSQIKERLCKDAPRYDLLVLPDSERLQNTLSHMQPFVGAQYEILFRPHPREWHMAQAKYATLLSHSHITLDDNCLYQSIAGARLVVVIAGNFLSTAVYEALALGKRVVCIGVDRPHIVGGDALLSCIKTYPDTAALLDDLDGLLDNSNRAFVDFEKFYNSNWNKSFTEFINQLV